MIRSTIAVLSGYFSIAFLNGFTRIIVSFYHREDLILSGVSAMPTPAWGYGIFIGGFFFGMFGGLITSTLAPGSILKHIVFLVVLILLSGSIDYLLFAGTEPGWWLYGAPTLKVAGIFSGYSIKRRQQENTKQ